MKLETVIADNETPPPKKEKKKSSCHDCSVNQRPNIISAKSFNQMEYVMNQYHF